MSAPMHLVKSFVGDSVRNRSRRLVLTQVHFSDDGQRLALVVWEYRDPPKSMAEMIAYEVEALLRRQRRVGGFLR